MSRRIALQWCKGLPCLDWALIVLVALAIGIPWSLVGLWRLTPDEAIYTYWALQIGRGGDPWLAATPGVDKPPLFLYVLALSLRYIGPWEFGARFPNLLSVGVMTALTYGLAWSVCGERHVGRLAGMLVALSPFTLLYGASTYADPLMAVLTLAAILAAVHQHWGAAGLLAGLAFLTKQDAITLWPLVALLGLGIRGRVVPPLSDTLRILTGLGFAFLLEIAWESQRPNQPSPFLLGLQHYGPIGVVSPDHWLPRLVAWWDSALRFLTGVVAVDVVTAILILVLLVGKRDHRDWLVAGAFAYGVLIHVVLGFQMWDRYLLAAVPLWAVLTARAVVEASRWLWDRLGWASVAGLAVLAALLLTSGTMPAMAGQVPIAGDHGRFHGLDETASFLRRTLPPGSVVYHHTLGWQFAYYLYGEPLSFWWYPSLDWLVDTAIHIAPHSQYLVLPAWEDDGTVAKLAQTRGLALIPVHHSYDLQGRVSFTTYRLSLLDTEDRGERGVGTNDLY